MKRFMNLPQLGVGYMGVDLGGGDGRMAKQGLHTADVRAIAQKIRGKGVP